MLKNIYYKIPPRLKNIAVTVTAFTQEKAKYGSIYLNFLRSLINEQRTGNGKQQRDLEEFLKYAKMNLLYYRKIKDIHSSPVLTKDDVIDNYDFLKAGKAYRTLSSSGTTGQELYVPWSKEAYQKEYAFCWYHRSFAGLKRGDRVATIAGHRIINVLQKHPPFWVYNNWENQLLFSSFHLSAQNLRYYVGELNRFKPYLINGFPSSIYLIAHHIMENNIKLDFVPKMIVASSESLLDFQRTVIEKALTCKVYSWYGNVEQCGHITECEHGKLHIQPRHSFVRILNSNNEDVADGERGRIVATNFLNKCFPLINYDTKDYVTLSKNQSCPCGRPGRIVEDIDGRIEDYIVLPNGRMIGRSGFIFKHAINVRLAQIEQRSVSQIIIHIQKSRDYTVQDEKIILDEARLVFG
ncbi:hypothetical protein AMJ87_14055, partial [candidate division WOR_3 bacterium SM23_60]